MRADAVEHRCRAVTYGKVFDLDHVPVLSRCWARGRWPGGGISGVATVAAEEGAAAELAACARSTRTGRGAAVIARSGARAMRAAARGNRRIGGEARQAPGSGEDRGRAAVSGVQ